VRYCAKKVQRALKPKFHHADFPETSPSGKAGRGGEGRGGKGRERRGGQIGEKKVRVEGGEGGKEGMKGR